MLLVIKTLDIKRYVFSKTCLYNFSRDFSSSLAIEMYGWPCFYIESTTILVKIIKLNFEENNYIIIMYLNFVVGNAIFTTDFLNLI